MSNYYCAPPKYTDACVQNLKSLKQVFQELLKCDINKNMAAKGQILSKLLVSIMHNT